MDLDTIIYIVAVVVTLIVSLLGQKKKKKNIPVQSETDDVVYSLNDFEKILQRKEVFEQAQEIEKEEIPIEESSGYNETIDIKHTNKEVENVDRKKEKEEKKKNVHKEEKDDGFDLNSAIIYSSILERKKFRH